MEQIPCDRCLYDWRFADRAAAIRACRQRMKADGVERRCHKCGASFLPDHGPRRLCDSCRVPDAEVMARWLSPIRRCRGCGNKFSVRRGSRKWFCNTECRPSYKKSDGTGLGSTFFINGMPCSEFVFQVVMRRRGIRVKKLRAGDPLFYFNGTQKYRPDFVDPKTNIYYEVSSSRQALHQSRPKLKMMKRYHPQTKILLVRPDGQEIQAP